MFPEDVRFPLTALYSLVGTQKLMFSDQMSHDDLGLQVSLRSWYRVCNRLDFQPNCVWSMDLSNLGHTLIVVTGE